MATRRKMLQVTGAAVATGTLVRAGMTGMAQEASPAAVAIGDISALPLREEGKLIIHADTPLYEPWFVENDPTNGQGFESALAYAIADKLGFTADQVEWGTTSFNASYAPGPKPFDFYLTEVSITPQRAEAVGFSDSYYDDPLVTIASADSAVLEATSIEELRPFKWSTQVGTTFHTYIDDVIKPEQDVLVFDTNADSVTAMVNGTVDGNIQNLQNAIYITTLQFEGLAIGGLLPDAVGDGMGLVTEIDSPLIPYLNAALAALKADGTHEALVTEWLPIPDDLITYTN